MKKILLTTLFRANTEQQWIEKIWGKKICPALALLSFIYHIHKIKSSALQMRIQEDQGNVINVIKLGDIFSYCT